MRPCFTHFRLTPGPNYEKRFAKLFVVGAYLVIAIQASTIIRIVWNARTHTEKICFPDNGKSRCCELDPARGLEDRSLQPTFWECVFSKAPWVAALPLANSGSALMTKY
jgi:hypothetical protein